MKQKTEQEGFTLIELMIVIAILAILLAIAIPAYQNYSIRAANSECVNLVSNVKLAVVDTAHSNGVLATGVTDMTMVGINAANVATPRCADLNVNAGVITIRSTGSNGTSDGTFTFEPTQNTINDSIQWNCTADHTNPQHVAAECRS